VRRLLPALLALTLSYILSSCATVGGPTVDRFEASPASVTAGAGVTLTWSVQGGTQVSVGIDPGVGGVSGAGSVTVHPAATTTYTLTARDATGVTTRQVTVTVVADTQSPSVTITGPATGTTVGSGSVSVTGTASDDVGVTSVRYSLNGGGPHACSGTTSFACTVTGLAAGANTVTVHAADAAGNDATATVNVSYTAATGDSFNIDLTFVSTISSTQRAAFEAAAARWGQVIAQGLPDTNVSIPQDACGYVPGSTTVGLPASPINGTIDDLRIDVWVGPIDGTYGILGQGGPCIVRGGDRLSVYGVMMFDSADLTYLAQNGLLQSTILHEMGHVLGIGTLWSYYRALLTGAGTADPRFVGANAVREWHALGGSNDVPVENCLDGSGNPITGCGGGTRDAHWREAVFGNELMTGYLDPGSDPLSAVTIGSLQDLGYAVDYGQADAYALPAGVRTLSLQAGKRASFLLITPKGEAP